MILTQIKASLQVSYDLEQANTVTYNVIAKSLTVEATSLGDPPSPLKESGTLTYVTIKHQRAESREQVAKYLLGLPKLD